MTRRIVVVGGDATGMSAANTALRHASDEVEVTVLEKGHYTSYSACGIPYWISGTVADGWRVVNHFPLEDWDIDHVPVGPAVSSPSRVACSVSCRTRGSETRRGV